MTRMLRYALIVTGAALALGTASLSQANVAPERGIWIPLFVIRMDVDDDDPVDKAIDELHGGLKNFIEDLSAMNNMTDAQKIAYIRDKFKERVKDAGYKQAYEYAKNQMKEYAESAVKAAAYDRIRARVTHEILINGALSNKAWELLKGQSDQAFEQIFGGLKLIGTGTEIVGGVVWDKFDKIVTNQYSWSEGALDVLAGVYDAVGESYIPFYGAFKKVVEIEMALIAALDSYCKDETINLWIGRVFSVSSLEAGFRIRLATTLRGYQSKDQLREVWRRNFADVTSTGYKVPWTDEKTKEYEAEAWMQVLGVWQEVQKDKELALKQQKELEIQALTARLDAERKLKAMQDAVKAGMEEGKKALARIEQFLRTDYPKAVKAQAQLLKQKAELEKGKTDGSAMEGETFEQPTQVLDYIRQFGAQLKSSWQQLTDVSNEARWAAMREYNTKLGELNNKNSAAYSRAYQKRQQKLAEAQRRYDQQQITYQQLEQEKAKFQKLSKDAQTQLEMTGAIINAEILATCSEVTTDLSVVADPIVDREIDRIIQNVNLSHETAVAELQKIRDEYAKVISPVAVFPRATISSPQSAIDYYETYVEFLAKARKWVEELAALEVREKKVVEKYDTEIFLQRELYKKYVADAQTWPNLWRGPEQRGNSGLGESGQWFVDVRPDVSPKSIEVKTLAATLKNPLEQAQAFVVAWEKNLEPIETRADLARPIIPFNAAAARLYGPNATSKVTKNSWISLTVTGRWDWTEWKFIPNMDEHRAEAKRLIDSLRGASTAYDSAKKANYYSIGGVRFDFPEPSNEVNKTGLVDGKWVTMLNPEIVKRVETHFLEPLRSRWSEISSDIPRLVELGSKVKRYGNYDRSDPLPFLFAVMSDSLLPEKIKIFEDAFKDLIARNTAAIAAYDKMVREGYQQAEAEQKRRQQEDQQRLETQTPIVRSIYDTFKRAYESRNDSGVAACLHKDWTAPDGTRISQMQETLRRSFRFFDEVKYEISDLKIAYSNYNFDGQTREDIYRVTYSLTIRGRNFSRNIRHEEKSQVTELVVIRDGKALIKQTIEGRTWPGDGRTP